MIRAVSDCGGRPNVGQKCIQWIARILQSGDSLEIVPVRPWETAAGRREEARTWYLRVLDLRADADVELKPTLAPDVCATRRCPTSSHRRA